MTNYHLPSTDRLAADFNPVSEDIAGLSVREANVFEAAAILVIGFLRESKRDLYESVIARAQASGITGPRLAAVSGDFDVVLGALDDILDPRLNAVRLAVRAAQSGEAPTYQADEDEDTAEGDEDPSIEALDDLLEEMFAEIIGAEAAAGIRRQVEGERALDAA